MLDQLAQQMGGMSLGPPTDEEVALDGLLDGFAKMNIESAWCWHEKANEVKSVCKRGYTTGQGLTHRPVNER